MRWLLISALAACTPSEEDASLAIVAPVDGSTVCGQDLLLQLDIQNFTLIPIGEGAEPHPDEGHVDVNVNGQGVDMQADDHLTLQLEAGAWRIQAYLVHADHSPLDPYAGDQVFITADDSLCGT